MAGVSESSTLIRNYMKELLGNFDKMRKCQKDEQIQYKTMVVITTADEDQSSAYKQQIAAKTRDSELPNQLTFLVYSDPPSVKIGSGGSVLNALKHLSAEYGAELYEMRVLLVCAGGQSQRLPTASVLGKLFLPLPIRRSVYQMLDLKLALYLPLLERSTNGTVLVTCSDDIETYYLPESNWTFGRDGFTALGHVSSVEIGKHHGVYVLPDEAKKSDCDVVEFSCIQVLQKPSEDEMKECDALLKRGKTVCTDSVFSFDGNVCHAFVDYVKLIGGAVTCEIDAYGDFLQPLGSRSNLDYIESKKTVVSATSTLAATRKQLYELLHRCPLKVVMLRHSRFYHLGTMSEYVDNLAPLSQNDFFDELGCDRFAFSRVTGLSESDFLARNPLATIMRSVITDSELVRIGPNSVVEFSRMHGPLTIGDRCIVSNCDINGRCLPAVPPNSCFHTVAVNVDGDPSEPRYVTAAFGIADDVKRSATVDTWQTELTYMGTSLGEACAKWRLKPCSEVVFGHVSSSLSFSLWNADLFVVADTMQESFRLTLEMICALSNPLVCYELPSGPSLRLSMDGILKCKDVHRMLAFQESLSSSVSKSS